MHLFVFIILPVCHEWTLPVVDDNHISNHPRSERYKNKQHVKSSSTSERQTRIRSYCCRCLIKIHSMHVCTAVGRVRSDFERSAAPVCCSLRNLETLSGIISHCLLLHFFSTRNLTLTACSKSGSREALVCLLSSLPHIRIYLQILYGGGGRSSLMYIPYVQQ